MKNLLLILIVSVSGICFGQIPPNAFNYSAVARDAQSNPITNQTIGIQISILQTSTLGPIKYQENHFVNTDDFGLFNLIIGTGAIQSGAMNSIVWSDDNFYIKVGMDVNGGTSFLTMGTTQLLSVPYALHAATAGAIIGSSNGSAPTVTTTPPTNILATSVNTGLTIVDNDNEFILASGICYGTTSTPTVDNTVFSTFGTWTGNTLTNLAPSTSYFARAFATSSNGTSYGNEISFTTISGNVIITTIPITGVSDSSFVTGGNIASDGGAIITQRGVCWSPSNTNPTISDSYTSNGTGTGSFTTGAFGIYSLAPNTLYYVRAYAVNAVGTFYGNTQSETTLPNCTNLSDTCSISSSFGNIAGHGGSVYTDGYNITFTMDNINLPITCSSYLQYNGTLNCSNSTFTIPFQSSGGCDISGSGFYNSTFDQLTVNYTIISGGITYNCTSVYTHLN